MSTKDNAGNKGSDGRATKHKGESEQSHQKKAQSVGKHDKGKHKKDESEGADHNTTKKHSNSI